MCPGSAAGPNTGACCPNGVTGLGIGACCPNALTSLGIWANYIKGREKVRWEPEGKPARWREPGERAERFDIGCTFTTCSFKYTWFKRNLCSSSIDLLRSTGSQNTTQNPQKFVTLEQGDPLALTPGSPQEKNVAGVIIQNIWTMWHNTCRSCINKNPFSTWTFLCL